MGNVLRFSTFRHLDAESCWMEKRFQLESLLIQVNPRRIVLRREVELRFPKTLRYPDSRKHEHTPQPYRKTRECCLTDGKRVIDYRTDTDGVHQARHAGRGRHHDR